MDFRVSADAMPAPALRSLLEARLASVVGIELRVEAPKSSFRGVDSSIVVALVSGAAAALVGFTSGLFAVARELRAQKVVVQGRDGGRLEFPANISKDKLDELITVLRRVDQPTVRLLLEDD